MTFKTSLRYLFARSLLLMLALFSVGIIFLLGTGVETPKYAAATYGGAFVGASLLCFVVMLARKSQSLIISEAGFSYSGMPEQFVRWDQIESVGPVASGAKLWLELKLGYSPSSQEGHNAAEEACRDRRLTIPLSCFLASQRNEIQSAFESNVAVANGHKTVAVADLYTDVITMLGNQEGCDPLELRADLDHFIDQNSERYFSLRAQNSEDLEHIVRVAARHKYRRLKKNNSVYMADGRQTPEPWKAYSSE